MPKLMIVLRVTCLWVIYLIFLNVEVGLTIILIHFILYKKIVSIQNLKSPLRSVVHHNMGQG